MLKCPVEKNWASNVSDLRSKYDLPLNDKNIANITKSVWKIMVKNQVKKLAFQYLYEASLANKKTKQLSYSRLERISYIATLEPDIARSIFEAGLRMYDVKANFKNKYNYNLTCPFCNKDDETFNDIFKCDSGVMCKSFIRFNYLLKLSCYKDMQYLKNTGKHFKRY